MFFYFIARIKGIFPMKINPNFYHQYQNKVNQNSKPQNFNGLFKPMQKQVFITPEVYQNYFNDNFYVL